MNLQSHFPYFNEKLLELFSRDCEIATIPAHQEILRKGQYVKGGKNIASISSKRSCNIT